MNGLKWTASLDDLMSEKLDKIQSKISEIGKVSDKVDDKIRSSSAKTSGILNKIPQEAKDAIGGQLGGLMDLAPMLSNPYVAMGAAATGAVVLAVKAGQHIMQVSQEVEAKQRQVAKAFGESDEKVREYTASAIALEKGFGMDLNESLIAANVQAKLFGVNGKESFDLLRKGAIVGADATGEMTDLIKEYSTQSKDVGLNAANQIAFIADSINKGFDPDKTLDSLKEVALKVANQDVNSALGKKLSESFGTEFTKGMLDSVNTGEISYFDFVKKVSQKSNELNLGQGKVKELLGVLGGGPLEDAGTTFFQTIGSINTNLDEMVAKAEKMNPHLSTQINLHEQIAAKQLSFSATYDGIAQKIEIVKMRGQLMFYSMVEKITPFIEKVEIVLLQFTNWISESVILQDAFHNLGVMADVVWNIISGAINLVSEAVTYQIERYGEMYKAVESFYMMARPYFQSLFQIVAAFADSLGDLMNFDWDGLKDNYNDVKAVLGGKMFNETAEVTVKRVGRTSGAFNSDGTRKNLGNEPSPTSPISPAPTFRGSTPPANNRSQEITGVSAGGKQVKNITFNITKMVETVSFTNNSDVKLSFQDFRRMLEAEMIKAAQNTELTLAS